MRMPMFRTDNTEGYTVEELVELNRMFAERLRAFSPEDRNEKSVLDHVAELVLAEFDSR